MQIFTDRKNFSSALFILGIGTLVVSLPLSNFGMSVGQFVVAAAWFVEGNYIAKLNRIRKSKPALFVLALYALHIIGLAYTSDLGLGLKDLRIKLPLLLLPLFFFSMEFYPSPKQFRFILYLFIAAVVAGTLAGVSVFAGIVNVEVDDIRDISLFISHIRFSLLICIAILMCAWFAGKEKLFPPGSRMLFAAIAAWLVVFLFILESITGIVALATVAFALLAIIAVKQKKKSYRVFFLVLLLAAPVSLFYYIKKTGASVSYKPKMDFSALEEKTSAGNFYFHDTLSTNTENGNLVWIYVCEKEMEQQWSRRSRLAYRGKDLKGQELRMTILRYMTSKGLRKDADGVNRLSHEDIHSIETGIANLNYRKMGNISSRIYQVIWEYYNYKEYGNPSGHSVMQRIEFWKAAAGVIKKFPVAGVGTGDIVAAYQEQYERMNSPLSERYRLRAHNQYLSIGAAFGIAGLAIFLGSLFAPFLILKKGNDYFYMTFLLIALVSFLTEDTLETQAGATFFAFFNTFFLRFRIKDEVSLPIS